jgi:hypothetical protein
MNIVRIDVFVAHLCSSAHFLSITEYCSVIGNTDLFHFKIFSFSKEYMCYFAQRVTNYQNVESIFLTSFGYSKVTQSKSRDGRC